MKLRLSIFYLVSMNFIIHNHTGTSYEYITKRPFLKFLFMVTGGHGPYHYIHHSSHEKEQMVNLGAGGIFLIFDRMFGTYVDVPEKRPPIGLTNQPEIHLSPMAMTFAGIAQITYELKHNKGLLTRFKIIFGGIYYKPPVTKDFLLKWVDKLSLKKSF